MIPTPLQNALKGVRVLDCSALFPGPSLAQSLQKLGAEVIKIENPNQKDRVHALGETYWDQLNEGKQIIQLDLKNLEARKELDEWVKKSDILIEAFRPAAKQKLGLSSNRLLSINPRLCIGSLTGYASSHPDADRAMHDINFQAESGLLSLFNETPPLPLADLMSIYQSAFYLMTQFLVCRRDQIGAVIELPMFDFTVDAQRYFAREAAHQRTPPKIGHTIFSGKYPCYGIYKTKDGVRVAVGAIESHFWKKLTDALHLPNAPESGLLEGQLGAEWKRKIAEAFEKQDWSKWEPIFEQANCCVSRVLEYSEINW